MSTALLLACVLQDGLVDRPPEDFLDSAASMRALELAPFPTRLQVETSIDAAQRFLLTSQAEVGSWGSWMPPLPGDEFWSNPYSHYAWIDATTGLVVMALLGQPGDEAAAAARRGVDFLLSRPVAQRPSDWDVDNTWAYVYALHALAEAHAATPASEVERRAAIVAKAGEHADALARYQTPSGGWGYYDFESLAHRPSWATSFTTAAAVVALLEARDQGFLLPEGMLAAAVTAVERCQLPNGAFSYDVSALPTGHVDLEWIDQVKGSLSRIQVCHDALWRAGSSQVDYDDLLTGLDRFFEEHRFLDIARKKPVPHETYYYNSGYFYFFGHYYAARVLDHLAPADRERYAKRLAREVTKTQEADGSAWDYPFQGYAKPYGTSFAILTLARTHP